jgi:hypothetical protein
MQHLTSVQHPAVLLHTPVGVPSWRRTWQHNVRKHLFSCFCLPARAIKQPSTLHHAVLACEHLQVHNKGVRDIKFSHDGMLLLAADDTGAVKISKANLAPVQTVQAHELVRCLG